MTNHILAVDIGNTNIACAVFRGGRIIRRFFIPTPAYTGRALHAGLGGVSIAGSIICSVVPPASRRLKKDIAAISDEKPRLLGSDMRVPVINRYRRPEQVGQDRLVNAYAAIRYYGAPVIVVDLGTAITFDVVSPRGEYLGGMILPGLRLGARALSEHTALLPPVTLRSPGEFIGRDTESSIRSGLLYGCAAVCDEFAEKIRARIGKTAPVVCAGGDSRLIARYCRAFTAIDPDLTLKGLHLIYTETT